MEFKGKIEKLSDEELAKVLKRLSILTQTKVYLFWAKDWINASKPPNSDVKPPLHNIWISLQH
jgi:hypothetical protein